MTQIITNTNGGGGSGGGGGEGDMKKSVYDPNNIQADAFDYNNFENTPDLSGYQTTGNLVTDLTNADNTHYPSAKAVADAISSSGGGDMLKSVYDPNNVNADAFDYNNFINTPTIPTVNNATLKIQENGTDVATFTANASTGVTANISVPTKVSDLSNDSGFVTNQVDDTAYGSSWDGKTTKAPSQNAVYDKISAMDTTISSKAADSDVVKLTGNQTIAGTKTFSTSPVVPSKTTAATNTGTAIATEAQVKTVADGVATINGMISSNASSSNKLMDKNYIDDSINSVTAYYITKNAQGDQWATRAELFAATTFYSGGVVRVPTKNDYTIVLSDEQHDNATTRYIYNSGWEYQYTVNETAMTQAQLDAINSGITSAKVSTYDGYASTIAGKQATLVSGTNIKTINGTSVLGNGNISTPDTTYTAGTGLALNGTEFSNTAPFNATNGGVKVFDFPAVNDDITDLVAWVSDGGGAILKEGGPSSNRHFRVTRVDLNTPFLTVECFAPSTNQTDAKNIFYNSSKIVTDIVDVSQNYFTPSGTATTGYVVTKTVGGYEWAAPTGGIQLAPNTELNIKYHRYGSQASYDSLNQYYTDTANDTAYFTI